MQFPKEAVRACDELAARYPQLTFSADERERRTLTRMIAEQLAFDLGPAWGCKKRRGLSDDFQSKDTLACHNAQGFFGWDWQDGTTRQRGPAAGAEGELLDPTAATFMPVSPTNHLGIAPAPGVGDPSDPVEGDQGETLQRLGPDVRASLGRVERRQRGLPVDGDEGDAPEVYEGEILDLRGKVIGGFKLRRRLGTFVGGTGGGQ